MENLERELICPLCKDYFTTPLLLPCQHNVCHKCAKDYVMGMSFRGNGVKSPTGILNGHSGSLNSPRTESPRSTPPRNSPVTSPRNISPAGSVTSLPAEGRKSPPESPRPTSATPAATAAGLRRKKKSLQRRATLSGPPILPSKKSLTPRDVKPSSPGSFTPRRERGDSFSGNTSKRDSGKIERRDSISSPRERGDSFSGSSTPRRLTREISVHVHTFYCPTCHVDVVLGEKGLNGLYRNFALQVIVDRFKFAVKKAASIPCSKCKSKPPADATKSCLDCKRSYCTECFANFHVWGTPRAQHECTGPTNHFRPKTITCTEHPEEKITLYCDGCQKPVCVKCKFSGVHANHKVAVIERKYAIVKEKLEKHLDAIRDRRDTIQESLDKLEALSASAETNSALVRQELTESLQRLQMLLADKQSTLPKETEDEISRRLGSLGEQIETYRGALAKCSVADLAGELLKETDHACFVQAAKPLLGRLNETVKSLKEAEANVGASDNFGAFSVDAERAIHALENMSFRKVPSTPTLHAKECQSYAEVVIHWSQPTDDIPVDTYTIYYRHLGEADNNTLPPRASPIPPSPSSLRRRANPPTTIDIAADSSWQKLTGLTGFKHTIPDLEPNSKYKFKLRAENKAGSSEFSKTVILRTIPAQVTQFKWTLCQSVNQPNTADVSKDGQRVVTSPSFSLANITSGMASGPIALSPTYILGDKKLLSGKHYWEIMVEQPPSAIQFGIISERKAQILDRQNGNGNQANGACADRDSGHDSCDEIDEDGGLSDPTVLVTYAMGRIMLPSCPPPPTSKHSPREGLKKQHERACSSPQPVPSSHILGVLVDSDSGRVSFYDGENKECMYSVSMKMTVPVQPALIVIGPGHIKSRPLVEYS
ncbi:E3 ubiquitin-protein ligase TRIM36-like isoform X2 [Amphiura filiformis]